MAPAPTSCEVFSSAPASAPFHPPPVWHPSIGRSDEDKSTDDPSDSSSDLEEDLWDDRVIPSLDSIITDVHSQGGKGLGAGGMMAHTSQISTCETCTGGASWTSPDPSTRPCTRQSLSSTDAADLKCRKDVASKGERTPPPPPLLHPPTGQGECMKHPRVPTITRSFNPRGERGGGTLRNISPRREAAGVQSCLARHRHCQSPVWSPRVLSCRILGQYYSSREAGLRYRHDRRWRLEAVHCSCDPRSPPSQGHRTNRLTSRSRQRKGAAADRWRRLRLAIMAAARLNRPLVSVVQDVSDIEGSGPPLTPWRGQHGDTKPAQDNAATSGAPHGDFGSSPRGSNVHKTTADDDERVVRNGAAPQSKDGEPDLSDTFPRADSRPDGGGARESPFRDALMRHRLHLRLFEATSAGDVMDWKKLYRDDPGRRIFDGSSHCSSVNAYNDHGYTQLHLAAQNGDLEMIKVLLEHGADPRLPLIPPACGPGGSHQQRLTTPLIAAARWAHADAVALLLTAWPPPAANINAALSNAGNDQVGAALRKHAEARQLKLGRTNTSPLGRNVPLLRFNSRVATNDGGGPRQRTSAVPSTSRGIPQAGPATAREKKRNKLLRRRCHSATSPSSATRAAGEGDASPSDSQGCCAVQ